MSKFKVGNEVIVITDRHGPSYAGKRTYSTQEGLIGTIISTEENHIRLPIIVQFKDHQNAYAETDLAFTNTLNIKERLGIV